MNTTTNICDTRGICPSCKGSWKGKLLTDEERVFFGPIDGILPEGSYSSLLIGQVDREVYDGVSTWICPHCSAEFPRFTPDFLENSKDAE